MKKLLLSFLSSLLLIPTLLFAQTKSSSHIWEAAAFGEIPGITHVRIAGLNPVPTTTLEAIWEESAAYTPLSAAMSAPYCASSDANDTSAGTGARTIQVKGINTSYAHFSETVTMNGTTSVVLATANILLFHSIEVLTAGSGGLNAGIVQCGTGANTAGDPAVTHAYLPISSTTVGAPAIGTGGGNKSAMFFYGVPDNYSLICKDWTVGSLGATAANTMVFAYDTYTDGGIFKRERIVLGEVGGNSSTVTQYMKIPEKTLIIGRTVNSAAILSQSMSVDCLLISDAWEDTAQDIF